MWCYRSCARSRPHSLRRHHFPALLSRLLFFATLLAVFVFARSSPVAALNTCEEIVRCAECVFDPTNGLMPPDLRCGWCASSASCVPVNDTVMEEYYKKKNETFRQQFCPKLLEKSHLSATLETTAPANRAILLRRAEELTCPDMTCSAAYTTGNIYFCRLPSIVQLVFALVLFLGNVLYFVWMRAVRQLPWRYEPWLSANIQSHTTNATPPGQPSGESAESDHSQWRNNSGVYRRGASQTHHCGEKHRFGGNIDWVIVPEEESSAGATTAASGTPAAPHKNVEDVRTDTQRQAVPSTFPATVNKDDTSQDNMRRSFAGKVVPETRAKTKTTLRDLHALRNSMIRRGGVCPLCKCLQSTTLGPGEVCHWCDIARLSFVPFFIGCWVSAMTIVLIFSFGLKPWFSDYYFTIILALAYSVYALLAVKVILARRKRIRTFPVERYGVVEEEEEVEKGKAALLAVGKNNSNNIGANGNGGVGKQDRVMPRKEYDLWCAWNDVQDVLQHTVYFELAFRHLLGRKLETVFPALLDFKAHYADCGCSNVFHSVYSPALVDGVDVFEASTAANRAPLLDLSGNSAAAAAAAAAGVGNSGEAAVYADGGDGSSNAPTGKWPARFRNGEGKDDYAAYGSPHPSVHVRSPTRRAPSARVSHKEKRRFSKHRRAYPYAEEEDQHRGRPFFSDDEDLETALNLKEQETARKHADVSRQESVKARQQRALGLTAVSLAPATAQPAAPDGSVASTSELYSSTMRNSLATPLRHDRQQSSYVLGPSREAQASQPPAAEDDALAEKQSHPSDTAASPSLHCTALRNDKNNDNEEGGAATTVHVDYLPDSTALASPPQSPGVAESSASAYSPHGQQQQWRYQGSLAAPLVPASAMMRSLPASSATRRAIPLSLLDQKRAETTQLLNTDLLGGPRLRKSLQQTLYRDEVILWYSKPRTYAVVQENAWLLVDLFAGLLIGVWLLSLSALTDTRYSIVRLSGETSVAVCGMLCIASFFLLLAMSVRGLSGLYLLTNERLITVREGILSPVINTTDVATVRHATMYGYPPSALLRFFCIHTEPALCFSWEVPAVQRKLPPIKSHNFQGLTNVHAFLMHFRLVAPKKLSGGAPLRSLSPPPPPREQSMASASPASAPLISQWQQHQPLSPPAPINVAMRHQRSSWRVNMFICTAFLIALPLMTVYPVAVPMSSSLFLMFTLLLVLCATFLRGLRAQQVTYAPLNLADEWIARIGDEPPASAISSRPPSFHSSPFDNNSYDEHTSIFPSQSHQASEDGEHAAHGAEDPAAGTGEPRGKQDDATVGASSGRQGNRQSADEVEMQNCLAEVNVPAAEEREKEARRQRHHFMHDSPTRGGILQRDENRFLQLPCDDESASEEVEADGDHVGDVSIEFAHPRHRDSRQKAEEDEQKQYRWQASPSQQQLFHGDDLQHVGAAGRHRVVEGKIGDVHKGDVAGKRSGGGSDGDGDNSDTIDRVARLRVTADCRTVRSPSQSSSPSANGGQRHTNQREVKRHLNSDSDGVDDADEAEEWRTLDDAAASHRQHHHRRQLEQQPYSPSPFNRSRNNSSVRVKYANENGSAKKGQTAHDGTDHPAPVHDRSRSQWSEHTGVVVTDTLSSTTVAIVTGDDALHLTSRGKLEESFPWGTSSTFPTDHSQQHHYPPPSHRSGSHSLRRVEPFHHNYRKNPSFGDTVASLALSTGDTNPQHGGSLLSTSFAGEAAWVVAATSTEPPPRGTTWGSAVLEGKEGIVQKRTSSDATEPRNA